MSGCYDGDHVYNGVRIVGGVLFIVTPTSAPADSDLNTNETAIWVDEAGNTLNFKVKYSTSVVKSGSIALT